MEFDFNPLALTLTPVLVILALLQTIIWVVSCIWIFSDAERRGSSGCLVALLVGLFFWPLSIIVWLLLRGDRQY